METVHLESGATARWFPAPGDGPTLVTVPAMGVPAAPYRRFAAAMQERGLTVVTADYRGQGESRVPLTSDCDWGYAELADDIHEVIEHVRAERDGEVVLVSHSLGGQITAALEARHPGSFDRLVLAASGTPYWKAFRGTAVIRPLWFSAVFAGMVRVHGMLEDEQLGFGRQPARLIREWARFAWTGRLTGGDPGPRPLPVLSVSFDDDTFAPRGAMADLVRRFPGADITRRHLESPTGHAGWLREPQPLVDTILVWAGS